MITISVPACMSTLGSYHYLLCLCVSLPNTCLIFHKQHCQSQHMQLYNISFYNIIFFLFYKRNECSLLNIWIYFYILLTLTLELIQIINIVTEHHYVYKEMSLTQFMNIRIMIILFDIFQDLYNNMNCKVDFFLFSFILTILVVYLDFKCFFFFWVMENSIFSTTSTFHWCTSVYIQCSIFLLFNVCLYMVNRCI